MNSTLEKIFDFIEEHQLLIVIVVAFAIMIAADLLGLPDLKGNY